MVKGGIFWRTPDHGTFWGHVLNAVLTKGVIQHIGIWEEDQTQGTAQQRETNGGVWQGIDCGSYKVG